MTRPEWSPEDRAEHRRNTLEELHARLAEQVSKLDSIDAWQRWLALARGLHSYSFSNLLLIASQRADATMVAGFSTWKQKGHSVRRGETAWFERPFSPQMWSPTFPAMSLRTPSVMCWWSAQGRCGGWAKGPSGLDRKLRREGKGQSLASVSSTGPPPIDQQAWKGHRHVVNQEHAELINMIDQLLAGTVTRAEAAQWAAQRSAEDADDPMVEEALELLLMSDEYQIRRSKPVGYLFDLDDLARVRHDPTRTEDPNRE